MKKHLTLVAAILILASIFIITSCQNSPSDKMYVAQIETSHGEMTILLLNETPLHLENFINHANNKFYNGMKFHRVIKEFVIQTGDPKTKEVDYPKNEYGEASEGLIKAEIYRPAIHSIGAVGMAREGDDVNPERNSSGSHFYIVTGNNNLDKETIAAAAEKSGYKYSTVEKERYLENGGVPRLDGAYVIFGYVIEGMDTVGVIENAEKDQRDVPFGDYIIKNIEIQKLTKKTIAKKYKYSGWID